MILYERGAKFERDIMSMLKEQGYTTIRTAGSHGIVDVIAMNTDCVRMIQAKTTVKTLLDKNGIYSLVGYESDIVKLLIECPSQIQKELWIKTMNKNKLTKVLIL